MRHLLHWTLPLAAILVSSLPAAAAPQILLAVGSDDAVPMRCEDNVCEAGLATMCLQPDRSDPVQGAPYRLLDPAALDVTAEGRDGRPVSVPLAGGLRVVAARGHTAIRVTIPHALLQRRGLSRPAVRLKGNAIFTPEPTEGDAEPQSEADIALARTTLRQTAANVIHQQVDRSRAAGVILGAINTLPRGRAPTTAERTAAETQLLSATAPGNARGLVREAFEHCRGLGTGFVSREPLFSYRGCLTVNHDAMLEEINMDYRAALKNAPGG
jgi:hypothetical protein